MSWHTVSHTLAGLAERNGFRVRVLFGSKHQVWATNEDMRNLRKQGIKG